VFVNGINPELRIVSIPNPLRFLGLARILAGSLIIVGGAATLRQYSFLLGQAERLFGPDTGTTGAPLRSLLTLLTAAALVLGGVVLAMKGFGWIRRISLPPGRPAAIARDEVVATLSRQQVPAYRDGHTGAYWPLRRWLSDEIGEIPWWRRDVVNSSVQTFVRSCGVSLVLLACCLAVPAITGDDPLGPFPTSFLIMLPFATAIGAVLALMLIGSSTPRIESLEFPLPADSALGPAPLDERIIESRPLRLDQETSGLALTMGVTGVATQCLVLWWWAISPLDYPLLATAIIRDAGSIAGGLLFVFLGGRMVASAAKLLLAFRYESTLVLLGRDEGVTVRAAAVRTESLGLNGPRHVVAAVAESYVREAAERLIADDHRDQNSDSWPNGARA
jgi:hypothetical protein